MFSTWLGGDDRHCGKDTNQTLKIDEACLSIINENSQPIILSSIVEECYMCDLLPWTNLSSNSNISLVVGTKYPLLVSYTDNINSGSEKLVFKEHGHYGWTITDDGHSGLYTLYDPPNQYRPFLVVFTICVLAALLYAVSFTLLRSLRKISLREHSDIQDDLGRLQENEPASQPPPRIPSKSSTRLHSVDAFRGICILLMIFVNNGGGKYVIFNHSLWNGLTIADLVLPWFAWIMGFTIVISLRTQLRISVSRGRIILHCLRRSLILILLGLIINSKHNYSLKNLRFPGVLQLLGVSYFICATIETIFMKAQRSYHPGRFMFLQDIWENWAQWLIVMGIVTIHTLITFLLPVPGCPTGYLGPGGYHFLGKYPNCTGGAIGYIDRLVFGNHVYNKTENPVYGHLAPHDPEGLMNILSAVLLVYMGVQAGRIALFYYNLNSKVIRWLVWAAITGIVAGALCNFSKENGVIPVNKNMMSLSYVLTMSSFALILFSILYYLIDYRRFWSGVPFIYAGVNPIFLYVGHYLTMDLFPWSWTISGVPSHTSYLLMNFWTTVLWAIIAYGLYKKDIIITI
ncbi:heparan-alpha-glucosaminide N-acetyltransferase [Cephus cinctus]|uniref:Heparan-alpha-glucosaminide N-acetyltransferase n=1 Tax=Cephus cinctus TaxID=211228 RepID=A0AAJ7BMY2_CEPCN|nr:heparan-alpha-glucosaminide N-acetyltransferase [Cephus cinctus]XP_015589962.1 heparan-alpha-glucosaminide N-acetyltransferase [Cephus cinctus]XP_024938075.1 heparan-alpha-glucosaminide N-acetyltransferase [Cephus cinctus]